MAKYWIRRLLFLVILPPVIVYSSYLGINMLNDASKPVVPHWVPSGKELPPDLVSEVGEDVNVLFIFTWDEACGYCKLSAPVLQESYKQLLVQYGGQVEVWAMNVGGDPDSTVVKWVNSYKWTMPQIGGINAQQATPITFVFARNPDGSMQEVRELQQRGQLQSGQLESVAAIFFSTGE